MYNTDNESNLGCGLFLVHSVIHSGNINDMHILKIIWNASDSTLVFPLKGIVQ